MIRLDLNNPEVQPIRLALERSKAWAVLNTLRRLQSLDWTQIQSSKGLRWTRIQSRSGPQGQRLTSPRLMRSCHPVACRDGSWLRLLSLHPDHDSAYR